MRSKEKPRIAIIGSGPIGLEAALYARQLDYPTTVYESGKVCDYIRRWGHVRLFSPFGMNITPLGKSLLLAENARHDFPDEEDCITGREHYSCYLEPLVNSEHLSDIIQTDTRVVQIGRAGLLKGDAIGSPKRAESPFRLFLIDANKKEQMVEADVVLDCSGTYGQARYIGDGGIPALGEMALRKSISYRLEDLLGEKKEKYAGKTVIVIGGGYSAATTVTNLAGLADKHPDTWVIWLARKENSQPIHRFPKDPLKERDSLAVKANRLATRNDANVEFHPDTVIERIESVDSGLTVTAHSSGETRSWSADAMIANVGYYPNTDMYRELQVHECYASQGPMKLAAGLLQQESADCLAQTGAGRDTLINPEPNFYILGTKSYGRNSHFLLRIGFEQVRDVFQLITGNQRLDLYH